MNTIASVAFTDVAVSIRAIYLLISHGLQKLYFLTRIPWLFGRLNQPGIKAEVFKQGRSCSWKDHHPASWEFFDPKGPLLKLMEDIDDDGCDELPPLLQDEVALC